MSQQAYLHKLFVRKHLIAVLRSSPTALVAFRHLPLRVGGRGRPIRRIALQISLMP